MPVGSRPRAAAKKRGLPSEQPMATAAGCAKSTINRDSAETCRSCRAAAQRLGTASVSEMSSAAESPRARGVPCKSTASSIGGSSAEPAKRVPSWPPGPPNSAHRGPAFVLLNAPQHALPIDPPFDVEQRGTQSVVCRVVSSSDVPGLGSSSQLAYRPVLMASAPVPHMNTPVFTSPTPTWTFQNSLTAQENSNSESHENVGQKLQKCCGKKGNQHAQLQLGRNQMRDRSSLSQKVGSPIASPVFSLGTAPTHEGNPNYSIYSSWPCPQMHATCSQPSAVHEPPDSSVDIVSRRGRNARFTHSLTPSRRRRNPRTTAQAMSTPETSQLCERSSVGSLPAPQPFCPNCPARFRWEEMQRQHAFQETPMRAPFPGPGSMNSSNAIEPIRSPQPSSENWAQQDLMPNVLYTPATSNTQGSQFVMPGMVQWPSAAQVSVPSSVQYLPHTTNVTPSIPLYWPGRHSYGPMALSPISSSPPSWRPISSSPSCLAVTMPQPVTLQHGGTVPQCVHRTGPREFPAFKENLLHLQCPTPASVAAPSPNVTFPDYAPPFMALPTAAPLISQLPVSQQKPTTKRRYCRKSGAVAELPEGAFPAPDSESEPGSLDTDAVVLMPASAMLVAPGSPPAHGRKMGGAPRKRDTTGENDQNGKKRKRSGKNSSDQVAGESFPREENQATTSNGLGKAPEGIRATVFQENQVQSAKMPAKDRLKSEMFLQDARCYDIAARIQKCRECWTGPCESNENVPNICRFYAFRKLYYSKTGLLHKGGFLEPSDASEEDMKLWLPQSDHTPSDADMTIAKFILSHVGNQFFALVKQENDARSLHMGGDNTVLWKCTVQGAREICDVCKTTLFNIHWTCCRCGFVACLDCYKARKNGTVKADGKPMTDRGEHKWPLCASRFRHELGTLTMTQMIAGTVLSDMSQHVRRFFQEWSICCNYGVGINDGGRQRDSSSGLCRPLMSAVTSCFSDEKGTAASRDMGHASELGKRPVNHVTNTSGEMGGSSSSFAEGGPFQSSSEIEQQSVELGYDNKNHDLSTALLDLLGQPSGSRVGKTRMDEVMAVAAECIGKDRQRCSNLQKGRRVLPARMCTLAKSSSSFPRVPHSWLCSGKLLVLSEPRNEGNLPLFQTQWKQGHPVLVSSVCNNLDPSLWCPDGFCHDFGLMQTDLIDCRTGRILRDQPMQIFWDGFESLRKRIKDENGKYMLLKLKDWPPSDDFSDVLPSRFTDLMNALPLPEYTHRDGVFNLVGRLPECFVRPDLGPKMYTAYGSALYPGKATTNLHLDVSDAVNVMVYVGILKDSDGKEHVIEALKAIDEACDTLTRKRVREKGARPGALWHIYNACDADKIRALLSKVAVERGKKVEPLHDPIHDQTWYLDCELRERLYREYSVEGYAIAQCLGDAVFIPAGAPHQVRNLHNCIKVAEDFVSPENIGQCFDLTYEFRQLSDMHTNHEDKLQIKNVIYHAVKDAVGVLLASPSGQK